MIETNSYEFTTDIISIKISEPLVVGFLVTSSNSIGEYIEKRKPFRYLLGQYSTGLIYRFTFIIQRCFATLSMSRDVDKGMDIHTK